MANVCERCKRSMSSHDNHASWPQCRMAAGECSLDSENPCTTCKVWTRRQWGKLRRSLIDARARSCQRGRQHWSAAFPRLEAWIQSKPASTSASEISSQAGEGDFEEDTLVGTPEQQVVQVLVVQAQNGANMASGTATTAPSTSTTAPSTAVTAELPCILFSRNFSVFLHKIRASEFIQLIPIIYNHKILEKSNKHAAIGSEV